MMGEVGQKYGLEADTSMSLDDFPTLRHLLDYIVPRVAGGEGGGAGDADGEDAVTSEVDLDATVSSSPAPSTPTPEVAPQRLPVAESPSTNGAAATNGNGAVMPAAPVSLDSGQVAAEIEAFLIDFVVEQTGYPEEIIELDVDLEADLGIDSIRKAQMMGEVGQKYGLEADTSMSLDDFPTLRHLLDYIVPRVAGGAGGDADGEEAVTSEVDLDATVSSSPVTSTPTPEVAPQRAPVAEAPATNGAAATNGNGAVMPAAPVSLDSGQLATEIEAFLIDFVVEQTGYPEEIIELDVDLEADLGIDSIRKAQMMGEVGQKYGLEADTSMSLDDFPTLRHLLDYIVPRVAGGGDEPLDEVNPQSQSPSEAQHAQSNGDHHGNGHASVVAESVTSVAYQTGLEMGRAGSAAIHQWSRSVAQSPADQSFECTLYRELQDQLEGIAPGSPGRSCPACRRCCGSDACCRQLRSAFGSSHRRIG